MNAYSAGTFCLTHHCLFPLEEKKVKLKKAFWNATIHNVKCCNNSGKSQYLNSDAWLLGILGKPKLQTHSKYEN